MNFAASSYAIANQTIDRFNGNFATAHAALILAAAVLEEGDTLDLNHTRVSDLKLAAARVRERQIASNNEPMSCK